uniref:Reverse transcriptase domain-containing protein n=1 Tax=Crocodylus porosus TaxID=8502 RepID=A0A7M4EYZ5_CROPO
NIKGMLSYREAESQIQINGHLYRAFKIHTGVRQGCPLSPLLFLCGMKLLAQRIRKNKVISQNWTQYSSCGLTKAEYKGRMTSQDLL